jgi:hypothetical protein
VTKQEVIEMGKRNLWKLSAIASACLMLVACGGGGGGGDTSTGSLSLSVTDAPATDVMAVCIHFTGVTLHHSNGNLISIPFDPSTYVDDTDCIDNVPSDGSGPDDPAKNNAVNLSELQGELSVALVNSKDVKAGFYNWIRLDVDESLSYVMDSRGQIPNDLSCPSCDGEQSGLKLNQGITVPADGEANVMIDIDLTNSLIKKPSGDYQLRPTLRLINLDEAGKITGTVMGSLISGLVTDSETGCSVYVYAGLDVDPDDYHMADTVLTSAKVVYDAGSAKYKYTAAYLQTDSDTDPTPYTVALTCDVDDSDVDQNNKPLISTATDVIFTDGSDDGVGQNADVSTGQTTVRDFPPSP